MQRDNREFAWGWRCLDPKLLPRLYGLPASSSPLSARVPPSRHLDGLETHMDFGRRQPLGEKGATAALLAQGKES